jgi:hypothetical protein
MLGRGVAGDAPNPVPAQAAPQEMASSSQEGAAQSADPAPELTAEGLDSSAAPPSDEGAGKPGEHAGSEPLPHRNKAADAAQPGPENVDDNQLIAKRLHGGALPK